MMIVEYESRQFNLFYDPLYGVGYIRTKPDGRNTLLITGMDMVELRRDINRARTNATARKMRTRSMSEIVDRMLWKYFEDP